MKKALPTLLIGAIVILLFDTIGSVASRQLGFNYSYLSFVSIFIYVGIAFFIAQKADKRTTIISTVILGLIDATIGWKLSALLQANIGDLHVELTAMTVFTSAIFMGLFAALLGLLAWWLSTKFSQTK